ncbi:MAG: PIG-L family deacetylase [Acetobacteraceae bacterium]|nr:PIG-L family deacetylase [Acetobacteraceae bacterium]
MTPDALDPSPLPLSSLEMITGNENLLVLAPHPGDESLRCGGLIAQCCRRGRPPFLMVLEDGSATGPYSPDERASRHEQETRQAVRHLGLPSERLLMVGLYEGTAWSGGPVFEAVVRAVALVMWARDCNVICAPAPQSGDPADEAAHRIAVEVAAQTGVGHLAYAGSPAVGGQRGWRLDISAQLAAKQAGIAAHPTAFAGAVLEQRWYELLLATGAVA